MSLARIMSIGVLMLGVVSCTEPGETTKMGAAAGGAVGAGLGAVVGSQTGSAGTGLVLGAVAGSATGALVGNSLEAQEKAIKTQDEAIERQERRLATQRNEIRELRRQQENDSRTSASSFNSYARSKLPPKKDRYALNRTEPITRTYSSPEKRTTAPRFAEPLQKSRATTPTSTKTLGGLKESTLVEPDSSAKKLTEPSPHAAKMETENLAKDDIETATPKTAMKGAYNWDSEKAGRKEMKESGASDAFAKDAVSAPQAGGSDCDKAESEVQSAMRVDEPADKLFHYRRALRLCPTKPGYHNGLGEVYLSLNRKADAEFEFKEALNIEPNYQPAKENLSQIRK